MKPGTQLSSVDLNIQALHTFRLVFDRGGYTAAAEAAGSSAPTIWHHVRELERAYGTALFKKVGRGIVPTQAAKTLYESIDEILVRLDSTFELVAEKEASSITIVTGVRMMMEDLAEPLADFRAVHENPICIRQGNDQRAEELIIADRADIALTLEPGVNNLSPQIHYEPAYSIDFLAVTRPDHPFAKANSGGLRELVKHELVVTTPGTHGRDALEQALHSQNLNASIAVETDNSGFTIACVQAGMGIGILAGRADGRLCQNLFTRSLTRQLGRRKIVIMWRKGRQLSQSLVNLVATIRQGRK